MLITMFLVGNARTLGMQKGLSLTDSQWNLCLTIIFLSICRFRSSEQHDPENFEAKCAADHPACYMGNHSYPYSSGERLQRPPRYKICLWGSRGENSLRSSITTSEMLIPCQRPAFSQLLHIS